MATVVIDIETVGQDFETLDAASQEYFLKFAKTDAEKEEARNSLSFFPVTAQVVAIGMLEVETENGFVYFQNGGAALFDEFKEGNVAFVSGSEKEILAKFWEQIRKYQQFVTFNGRVFDCPFLMIRSAINRVKTTKNLMPNRYSGTTHVDLMDQLTFYDAVRRRFSLHMWCKAFGIESPKEEGMTGLQVKEYYQKGRYKEIARYCLADIKATKRLYLYWDQYLKI